MLLPCRRRERPRRPAVTQTGRMGRSRRLLGVLAASALLAGCAGSGPTARASSAAAPLWVGPTQQRPAKVLIVVEENRTPRSALAGMPYLASLARTFGRTSAYKAVAHPSLPNYLA